jgi:cardiolipin synthase
MKLRHIPNALTCLRFFLIGPVLVALLNKQYSLALSFFVLAGITDALDGLLARLYGWTSRFGAIADPLADKLLLMSSFIALYWLKNVPGWLVIAIVARDIWIMLGVLSYRLFIGPLKFTPSLISKINTFLQILLVPLLLFSFSWVPLPYYIIQGMFYAVLITCIASFLHYTYAWSVRAMKYRQMRASKNYAIVMQKEML